MLALIASDDEWVELRHLVAFEAVVRCGGFTRAAEDLRVAQPAISAQVRALESELGVTLLARTTRKVSQTQAGELLLARVRRVLGELDAARGELEELSGVLRGRVTLGATPVLGRIDLPRVLAGFHARYPGVSVVLRSGLVSELLVELDHGEIDLVLGPVHSDLPSRYRAEPLVREEVVLVLPPGHRLARPEAAPSLADLRDEMFVCLPRGSGLRGMLDLATAAAGFRPQVQFEAATTGSVRDLVAAGLGIALLARSAADGPGAPVVVRALAVTPPHPPIGLIRRDDRPAQPAAQACFEHIFTAARTDRHHSTAAVR